LYYEAAGEGHPLVLLHADIADRTMWDDQWEPFAGQYRVIRYDRPGFGKSPLAEGATSNVQALADLLDHLGVQKAHLLGCSGGGTLALDFALAHPDRVSALILESATPSGFQMQGEPPQDVMERIAALQAGDSKRAAEIGVRLWAAGPSRKPEQLDATFRDRVRQLDQAVIESRGQAMMQQPQEPDPPAAARLSDVKAPALIIVGKLDHPEVIRGGNEMAGAISDAEKTAIPDTAHLANMEQPAEFNRIVLNFLADVDV
jgi:pimeloyl-ACP methyl ester carboxylesterase